MRISSLLAALAFAATGFAVSAVADSTMDRPAAARSEAASLQACLENAKGMKLAQIDCCKGHKGICGCRAGKIVCCDNTTSTEPGCTCHGDEGIVE